MHTRRGRGTDFVTVWRIAQDTPEYGADDLSGRGAERTGGRFNRRGVATIYASTSRALACLETLVHLTSPFPLNRYLVELRIPVASWRARRVFDATDNVGWDAEPPGLVSIGWGTRWLESRASLIAEVPSVIVPEETNVLVNPAHPDARGVQAIKRRRWVYDIRTRPAALV